LLNQINYNKKIFREADKQLLMNFITNI